MPELIDTFDEYGNKTGIIEKGQNTNDYVKCCTCFVVNNKNEILIEKRGNTVLDAGKLDLCSGHVDSGETETQGMVRELNEELGIKKEEAINIKKIGNLKINFGYKCIVSIYCLKISNLDFILQNDEVKEIEFYDIEEVFNLIREGKTRFPYDNRYEEIFSKLKEELGIKLKEDNKNEMEI